jgi:lipopolysaccharide export system protein LptC
MLTRSIYKLHQYLPVPWVLVGLLVLCFFFLVLRPKEDAQANLNADGSSFPQFYMEQVQTREFDAQGKLHYQLDTPLVAHFQLDPTGPGSSDYTLITQPQMAFYGTDSPAPWVLHADKGRSENDGQLLRLLDNVVIQQESPNRGQLIISTSELRVRAKEQFAETDKAVNMRSAKGQIDAIGMNAQLSESRIELTSQVKAVYEPR